MEKEQKKTERDAKKSMPQKPRSSFLLYCDVARTEVRDHNLHFKFRPHARPGAPILRTGVADRGVEIAIYLAALAQTALACTIDVSGSCSMTARAPVLIPVLRGSSHSGTSW